MYPNELARLRRLTHRAVNFVDCHSRASHLVVKAKNSCVGWQKLKQWAGCEAYLLRSAAVVEVLELEGTSAEECEGLWGALRMMCAAGMPRVRKIKLHFDLSQVKGHRSIQCALPSLEYLELNMNAMIDKRILRIDAVSLQVIKLTLGDTQCLDTQLINTYRDALYNLSTLR